MQKQNDSRTAREERRKRENRETILHAAEVVIQAKGFSPSSMDDVAAEAGFSKATLYRYFKSKTELLFEILIHFFEDMETGLDEIRRRPGSCRERLRESLIFAFRFQAEKENLSRIFLSDPSYIKLMHAIMADTEGRTHAAERRFLRSLREGRRRLGEGLAELLREGVSRGEFRSLDVPATVVFLAALVQGYSHEVYWMESEPDLDKSVSLLERLIWQGIGKTETP